MKKWILMMAMVCSGMVAGAQMADTTLPYYKRFPVITPFQILLSDSSTMYTRDQLPKKTPVAFIIFSPDCNHCQKEAEEIVSLKDQLDGVQLVMITMHSFAAMKDFISKYKLDAVPNLVVGRDIYYTMPAYYNFHHLPFHAFYNKKGKLLSVFEGSMPVAQLIRVLKEEK